MRYALLILVSFLTIGACKQKQSLTDKQKELSSGILDPQNTYTAEEIGWSVQLPRGWDVLTKDALKKNTIKGAKLIEETTKTDIDASGLVQLINIRKDAFNSFLSTMERFDTTGVGTYEEYNQFVFDLIKQTYEGKGMNVKYQEGAEMINGIEFQTFETKLFSPDKSKVILYQKMFNRLINGYDFGMTMNYNNDTDKETLEEMVRSSRFRIRD
ncbi:MAG TPA: hypothetical protein VF476_04890 [Chitinophagaceae bacterium]